MKYINVPVYNTAHSAPCDEQEQGDVIFNNSSVMYNPGAFSAAVPARPIDDKDFLDTDRKVYYFHNMNREIRVIDRDNFISYVKRKPGTVISGSFRGELAKQVIDRDPNIVKNLEGSNIRRVSISGDALTQAATTGVYVVEYRTIRIPLHMNNDHTAADLEAFKVYYDANEPIVYRTPEEAMKVKELVYNAIAGKTGKAVIRTITFVPASAFDVEGHFYVPTLDLVFAEGSMNMNVVHPRSPMGEDMNKVVKETNCVVINVNDVSSSQTGYWIRVGNRVEKIIHNRNHAKPEGGEIRIHTSDGYIHTSKVETLEELTDLGIYTTKELSRHDGVLPSQAEEIERRTREQKQLLDYYKLDREAEMESIKHNHSKERLEMERALTMLKHEIEYESGMTDLEFNRLSNTKKLMDYMLSMDKNLTEYGLFKTKVEQEIELLNKKNDYEHFKVSSDAMLKVVNIGSKLLGIK